MKYHFKILCADSCMCGFHSLSLLLSLDSYLVDCTADKILCIHTFSVASISQQQSLVYQSALHCSQQQSGQSSTATALVNQHQVQVLALQQLNQQQVQAGR